MCFLSKSIKVTEKSQKSSQLSKNLEKMEKQKKQRKSNQVIEFMKNIVKLQEIIKHDWNPLTLSSFQTFYIFQSKVLMHTNLDCGRKTLYKSS